MCRLSIIIVEGRDALDVARCVVVGVVMWPVDYRTVPVALHRGTGHVQLGGDGGTTMQV